MSADGTASYEGVSDLPAVVAASVALARELGFTISCRIEQGRLLERLAAGHRTGRIGETGTGCGVGLAWMLSGAGPAARLHSVEVDAGRAAACQALFARYANVTVEQGDWRLIGDRGPFDLLVLDGGGGGKTEAPIEIEPVLAPGGTVVIDDFTPMTSWPPEHDGAVDAARLHWLSHRDLLATEIRLADDLATVVATRRR
jgi:predicted O-methyltransferase YrrM